MKTLKDRILIGTASAALALIPGSIAVQAETSSSPLQVAQATSTETSCIPLQEVTTGQNEIRKRIENRAVLGNNWHTDFVVPNDTEFSYFVALITPENDGPYWMDVHLRQSHGGSEKVFSERADLEAGVTVSVPFESPTGRQPAVVNVRLGGVNGNFYTIAVAACQ
jgi:hypothetical protein